MTAPNPLFVLAFITVPQRGLRRKPFTQELAALIID